MNYNILRILVTFVILGTIFIILRKPIIQGLIIKIVKTKRKYKLITSLVTFIIFIIIWVIPYESIFIKFKTVDEAFNYYYASEKIINKYIYDDVAYVLFSAKKDDSIGLVYYIKSNNNWKIDNVFRKGQGKIKVYKQYTILINEVKAKNTTGILITYLINENKDTEIKDSLSSNFETVSKKNIFDKQILITKLAIINQNLNDNYTILFDGKEYKPFK